MERFPSASSGGAALEMNKAIGANNTPHVWEVTCNTEEQVRDEVLGQANAKREYKVLYVIKLKCRDKDDLFSSSGKYL